MKQILNILYSTKTTLVLLLIFTVAIGAATFVEDAYDTITAKRWIYNAKWLEVVLFFLIINFIGNITKYNLLSIKKVGGLIFHLAFIVLIVGGGITRYTGLEGNMRIREGESSNIIYSSTPYLLVFVNDGKENYSYDVPIYLNEYSDNDVQLTIRSEEKGPIDIQLQSFVSNAVEQLQEEVEGGGNVIELFVAIEDRSATIFLEDGENRTFGEFSIGYNNIEQEHGVQLVDKDGGLRLIVPHDIRHVKMPEKVVDTLSKDSLVMLVENDVYNVHGAYFACKKIHRNSKIQLVSGNEDAKGADALLMDVTFSGKTYSAPVFGGSGYNAKYQEFTFDGMVFNFAYGNKPIELPFSIYLNDFILDRYAGSMSPSSYASEVTVIDDRTGVKEPHRIFMNNVLDHDGYRFFQSSYDNDEKGTILSVNHDFFGTWISYFGYFLLGLGFVISLFSRNSRFNELGRRIRQIRVDRKALTMIIALLLLSNGTLLAQESISKAVSSEHANKFGRLIVQTRDGRFQPIHSLANDVIHKISKKDKFDIKGKGEMDGMQVFLDMLIDPDFWKHQKMIYVREESVRDIIGSNGKLASFSDFFKEHREYKLSEYSSNASIKKQGEQNKFDKEIIKVEDRVNVCMMVYRGSFLKIFPLQNGENYEWINLEDSLAFVPLTGSVGVINDFLQLDEFSYASFLRLYLEELEKAVKTGDYTEADKILAYISQVQRQGTPEELLPSESMIDYEIRYNKSMIFIKLKNYYALLSLILFVLAFIDNLRVKTSKIVRILLYFFIALLALAFLYHTYGMVIRWYLTGHAPWSNGYEALILIAWGGLLAGFCFMRNSKITLAATTLLAFFMLMTASHSSYDPQLTNLEPVLKSYWLIIHVAVITISYGFLGLGLFLGLVNLFIYLFLTKKNVNRLGQTIKELTYINEMTITVGLMLAVIGTFLGGVWANESWGRYWGWDAKETWALVIVITYTMLLHFRFIPKLKSAYAFNVGSVIGFGSVLMTFIGVNYYLSKGLHSYASGDTPVFPVWAWVMIIGIIMVMMGAGSKEKLLKS